MSAHRMDRGRLLAVSVFLAVLAINLLGASYVATEGDPLNEQERVLAVQEELRPSHLSQTTLFRAAWQFASGAFGAERPFIALQTLNAILGALASVLILLLLLRLGVSRPVAVFMALFWALSFAPWLHSRTAETGVTPVPFLLGALLPLLRTSDAVRPTADPVVSAGDSASRRMGICAALLIGIAISLSLDTVLLVPGFLYLMWRRRILLSGMVTLAVVVGVPFGFVLASSGATDVSSAVAVLTHHPNAEMLGSSFSLMSLPRALSGIGRLLFPFALGESAVKMKMAGHAVGMGASEWGGLLRNTGGALVLVGVFLVAWWRVRRGVLGWFLLLAGLPVTVFCVYWLGSDPQFWLPYYSMMLIAIGTLLGSMASVPSRRYVLIGLAALLLVFMFGTNRSLGAPCPLSPNGSARWQAAQELSANLPRGAVVYLPGPMVHLPFGLLRGMRADVDVVHLAADARLAGRDEQFLESLYRMTMSSMEQARNVYAFAGEDSFTPASLGAWEGLGKGRGITRAEFGSFLSERFTMADAVTGHSLVELSLLDE